MTNKTFRSPCLLGLVDGILIGALTGALIAIYVEHRNAQILDEILDRSLLTETFHLIGRTELLWIICINFFI